MEKLKLKVGVARLGAAIYVMLGPLCNPGPSAAPSPSLTCESPSRLQVSVHSRLQRTSVPLHVAHSSCHHICAALVLSATYLAPLFLH